MSRANLLGLIVAVGASTFSGYVLGATHPATPQPRVIGFGNSFDDCATQAKTYDVPPAHVGMVGSEIVTAPAGLKSLIDIRGYVIPAGAPMPSGQVAMGTLYACLDDAGLSERAWLAK